MRSPPNEMRAVMGPLDPALVGVAMLLCFGLAVGKDIGKDPNTGCGKGAVVAGGGAVAGGAALSKAGLLGSKAASVGAKVASVGAKATGVGATATLAGDAARLGAMSDDAARVGAISGDLAPVAGISDDVARVGATMSDDVARTAASGGHGFDGVEGARFATHAAQSANHLGHAAEHSSVSGTDAPCTHANAALHGLVNGHIPTGFRGATVQPTDPGAPAWSSDQLRSSMRAATVMDPCDPSIDAVDLTPRQRAIVTDESGQYQVLVLDGGHMLVELSGGTKLLLAPTE